MFVRTQPAGAFEMITSTLRHSIEWHELLAAICEFINHSASDDSHTLDSLFIPRLCGFPRQR
jgi:hypothetical protein